MLISLRVFAILALALTGVVGEVKVVVAWEPQELAVVGDRASGQLQRVLHPHGVIDWLGAEDGVDVLQAGFNVLGGLLLECKDKFLRGQQAVSVQVEGLELDLQELIVLFAVRLGRGVLVHRDEAVAVLVVRHHDVLDLQLEHGLVVCWVEQNVHLRLRELAVAVLVCNVEPAVESLHEVVGSASLGWERQAELLEVNEAVLVLVDHLHFLLELHILHPLEVLAVELLELIVGDHAVLVLVDNVEQLGHLGLHLVTREPRGLVVDDVFVAVLGKQGSRRHCQG
ncbi:hypothetical protein BOVATA_003020 [Babesia ovata]|uniref:Secreted protein n=1 Tax=Babesia ovata TaxID=189622 RepID=A0A2H6K780_9APIC|nr:uncharacterized protein BOVATA_003020 [Babesia ovata]GBE58809.1 hypothetical protein BOVATA_003020 [Babesia ovata]